MVEAGAGHPSLRNEYRLDASRGVARRTRDFVADRARTHLDQVLRDRARLALRPCERSRTLDGTCRAAGADAALEWRRGRYVDRQIVQRCAFVERSDRLDDAFDVAVRRLTRRHQRLELERVATLAVRLHGDRLEVCAARSTAL